MANQVFHSKLTAEAGTASTDVIIKSQLDAAEAAAKARANHTGTQLMATISDAQTYVDGRVQLIVDAAPAALDTLNELAAALGDDANFAATTATSLAALDTRLDALEAPGPSSYKATIGDAAASTFTVTHSLGSTDVAVEVFKISTGQTEHPVVTRPGANTVGLDFGTTVPASASYRVLVRLVP